MNSKIEVNKKEKGNKHEREKREGSAAKNEHGALETPTKKEKRLVKLLKVETRQERANAPGSASMDPSWQERPRALGSASTDPSWQERSRAPGSATTNPSRQERPRAPGSATADLSQQERANAPGSASTTTTSIGVNVYSDYLVCTYM